MRTEAFDFDLPETSIALHPADPRDAARMLVVRPEESAAAFSDSTVSKLPDWLRPGDALVFNDTKVIPAALAGLRQRGDSRAAISVNLMKRLDAHRWTALARPAKRLAAEDRVAFGQSSSASSACRLGSLDATIEARGSAGEVTLAFDLAGPDLDAAIAAHGQMPLPPYIASKRQSGDQDRLAYQTMFAARDGAVAAPTAGLHFTPSLMDALKARGVSRHFVTLHVGGGTFLPVKADDTNDHVMHGEWGEVSDETATALTSARQRGGRIVAVGTTSLRLIESSADETGEIRPFSGETAIFITPGYRFRAVDVLLTNFHLPRSTLFMLVSAFAGLETMRSAYSHAIARGYRFYSYGDACLLFREALDQDSRLR